MTAILGLAAIVAADVAGYSRLMGSGRGRHARTPFGCELIVWRIKTKLRLS